MQVKLTCSLDCTYTVTLDRRTLRGTRDRPHREDAALQGPARGRHAPRAGRRARRGEHRARRHRLALLPLALILAGCGGHGHHFVVGAVEDAAKFAPDPRAQMRLARDGNLRAVALSAVWHRGARARTTCRRSAVRSTRPTPTASARCSPSTSSARDARRSRRRARNSPPTLAALARALPSVHDVIVGNEPNLNLFWLPQFDGRLRRCGGRLRVAARRDLRRAQGRRPGHRRDRRRARAARRRPPVGPADALADRVPARPRRRLPRERAHEADHGRALDPPVRRELAHPADARPPAHDPDRDRRLRKLVTLLGRAFDGTAQPGRRSRSSTASTASRHDPAGQGLALHRPRGRPPGRRATQARYYTAGDRPRRLPADRAHAALFHVVDETALEGLQSGDPLRRRHRRSRATSAVRAAAGRGLHARLGFVSWRVSTSHTRSSASTRLAPAAGGGARGAQGRVRRGRRGARRAVRDLRTYSTTGVRPETRLLPLEDHRALRGPRRARRGAQRDAARRLARDAVLLPRDDEGIAVHAGAQGRKIPPKLAVPRRLPVRQGAAVVRAPRGGAAARDGRAHPHRPRGVPDDPQPHDVLVRDRRPGVHDRVRVRRACGLHAPDAARCATPRRRATPSATRRSSSASTCRSARRSPASTASRRSSKTRPSRSGAGRARCGSPRRRTPRRRRRRRARPARPDWPKSHQPMSTTSSATAA